MRKSSPAFVIYYADGKFSGFDGCNTIGGNAELVNFRLELSNVTSTKRACDFGKEGGGPDGSLFQSGKYFFNNGRIYLGPEPRKGEQRVVIVLEKMPDPEGFSGYSSVAELKNLGPAVPLHGSGANQKASLTSWADLRPGKVQFIVPGKTPFSTEMGYQALYSSNGENELRPVLPEFQWREKPPETKGPDLGNYPYRVTYPGEVEPLAVFTGLSKLGKVKGVHNPYLGHQNAYQIVSWENRWYHIAWVRPDAIFEDLPNRQGLDFGDKKLIVWASENQQSQLTTVLSHRAEHPPVWSWLGDLNFDGAPDFIFELFAPTTRLLLLSGPEGKYEWIAVPTAQSKPKLHEKYQELPGNWIGYRSGDPKARVDICLWTEPDGTFSHPRIFSSCEDTEMYAAIDSFLQQLKIQPGMNQFERVPMPITLSLNFYNPKLAYQGKEIPQEENVRATVMEALEMEVLNLIGAENLRAWQDKTLSFPQEEDGLPVWGDGNGNFQAMMRLNIPAPNPANAVAVTPYSLVGRLDSAGNLLEKLDLPNCRKDPAGCRFLPAETLREAVEEELPEEFLTQDAWSHPTMVFDTAAGHFAWDFTYNVITRYPRGKRARIRVDASTGKILASEVDAKANFQKCLPQDALIETPMGKRQVNLLKAGDPVFSMDERGRKIIMPLAKVNSVPAGKNHQMTRLDFENGARVMATPGHPMPWHRVVQNVVFSSDSVRVTARQTVPYYGPATWDILPEGPTGYYFIDGIAVASTLSESSPDKTADSIYNAQLVQTAEILIQARLGVETGPDQIELEHAHCLEGTRQAGAHTGHPAEVIFRVNTLPRSERECFYVPIRFDPAGKPLTDLSNYLPDCREEPIRCQPKPLIFWKPRLANLSNLSDPRFPFFDGKYLYAVKNRDRRIPLLFRFYWNKSICYRVNLSTGEMENRVLSRGFRQKIIHKPLPHPRKSPNRAVSAQGR